MAIHVYKSVRRCYNFKIPDSLDKEAKDLLMGIMEKCIEEKYQKLVKDAVDNMARSTDGLIDWLKRADIYTKDLEDGIRRFMAIHLNHGFELGMAMIPEDAEDEESEDDEGPGRRTLDEILESQIDIGKIVKKLPKSKKALGEIILYAMDLGSLAHETGFVLASYVSEATLERHYKNLKEENVYIG